LSALPGATWVFLSMHILPRANVTVCPQLVKADPSIAPELEQRIKAALAVPGRPGFHKLAAQFGVASGTIQRIAWGLGLS